MEHNRRVLPILPLKWETSEQTNFGLDFGTLNSTLTLTLDYYIKTTKGELVVAPVPMLVGNSAPYINGGSVRNSGIEAEVSYRRILGKLYLSASVNGAFNRNEVLDIRNTEKRDCRVVMEDLAERNPVR